MSKLEHEGLIHREARKRLWALGEGLDFEDLLQAGRVGVALARQRFDPNRGLKFSTYALFWIRNAIHRECVKHGRMVREPEYLNARRVKSRAGARELAVRLDDPGPSGEGALLDSFVDLSAGPDDKLDAARSVERVRLALAALPPRLRTIVVLRHVDELSLAQAGKRLRTEGGRLGLSYERVRQLERQALELLREALTDLSEAA